MFERECEGDEVSECECLSARECEGDEVSECLSASERVFECE